MSCFCFFGNAARADEFGDFTYEDLGDHVAITDYPDTVVGPVVIPSSILGKPVRIIEAAAFNEVAGMTSVTIPSSVTTIGSDAFALCPALTTVAIPASVTSIGASAFYECAALTGLVLPPGLVSIGEQAFYHCTSLTSLTIPAGVTIIESRLCEGCDGLTSVKMGAGVTAIRNDAFTGCHGLAGVTIPEGVASIENYAFFDCPGLTHVTIPAAVTSIGNGAFDDCDQLDKVFFMGNAPSMGETVFVIPVGNPDLRIHFFTGKSGFTSPKWLFEEYETIDMGPENPIVPWLIGHNLSAGSDLLDDTDGDGVNLLTAYALDLDPHANLSSSLPQPVFGAGQMSLSFYAGKAGVTYSVETCDNLQDWTTTGVELSAPDANSIRTATVAFSGTQRFMRLAIRN